MIPQQRFSKNRKAFLILEDGTIFRDNGFESTQNDPDELVFSTSMVWCFGGIAEENIIESEEDYAAT